MGDEMVGLFMADGAYDAGLFVGPSGDPNPGVFPGPGLAALGGDDERREDSSAVRQSRLDTVGGPGKLRHPGRRRRMDPVDLPHPVEKRLPEHPIFHHVAERFFADVMVIIVQEQVGSTLRYPNIQHRSRIVLHSVPQADTFQKPA